MSSKRPTLVFLSYRRTDSVQESLPFDPKLEYYRQLYERKIVESRRDGNSYCAWASRLENAAVDDAIIAIQQYAHRIDLKVRSIENFVIIADFRRIDKSPSNLKYKNRNISLLDDEALPLTIRCDGIEIFCAIQRKYLRLLIGGMQDISINKKLEIHVLFDRGGKNYTSQIRSLNNPEVKKIVDNSTEIRGLEEEFVKGNQSRIRRLKKTIMSDRPDLFDLDSIDIINKISIDLETEMKQKASENLQGSRIVPTVLDDILPEY